MSQDFLSIQYTRVLVDYGTYTQSRAESNKLNSTHKQTTPRNFSNICPKSLVHFYKVSCFINWTKTSWAYSIRKYMCTVKTIPSEYIYYIYIELAYTQPPGFQNLQNESTEGQEDR